MQCLTKFFNKEPKVLYVGGGVPALAYVPEAGGPQLTTFGFQRSDEGFHADNEYMRIDSFQKSPACLYSTITRYRRSA